MPCDQGKRLLQDGLTYLFTTASGAAAMLAGESVADAVLATKVLCDKIAAPSK